VVIFRLVSKLRELRNYTQEYMAECLGISQVSYSRIENGQTKFDIQRMQQIGVVLELHPVMLLYFDEHFAFNNCSQMQGKQDTINNYNRLFEKERNALLKRN